MVVKPIYLCNITELQFENGVVSNGSQAFQAYSHVVWQFENGVVSNGSQAYRFTYKSLFYV